MQQNGNLHVFFDDLAVGVVAGGSDSSMTSSNLPMMAPGANYIEHQVSKMDTLAGVAIKYGVEVKSQVNSISFAVVDSKLLLSCVPSLLFFYLLH